MRRKKTIVSYLTWIIYAVAAEVGLVCLADAACDARGIPIWYGTAACVAYMLLAGGCVFLIHRRLSRGSALRQEGQRTAEILRAAAATVLFAGGLFLRIRNIPMATESAAYFEVASVSSGTELPQLVHGAVYFYIRLLYGLFFFLGNKFAVAIWTQILLQLLAALFLYVAVRRLTGDVSALVMLAFLMLSPYMIQGAVDLSPEMLYLAIWSGLLLLLSFLGKRDAGKGGVGFFLLGAAIAFAGYLDVAGFLLLPLTVTVIFSRETDGTPGQRRIRLLLCAAGALSGFFGSVGLDALASGKTFVGVLSAWGNLYRPLSFRFFSQTAVSGQESAEWIILFGILVFGIFSFWRDGRRDAFRGWTFAAALTALAGCFGIFTVEMPADRVFYLLLAVLAGVAVQEALRPLEAVRLQEMDFPSVINLDEETADGGAVSETEGLCAVTAKDTAADDGRAQETADGRECGTAKGKDTADDGRAQEAPAGGAQEAADGKRQTKDAGLPKKVVLIENPLPLPKKHEKRTMNYRLDAEEADDFDLDVDEEDDFDL